MTSYYFEIGQCPDCGCKFTAISVASCNTFGAKFYTDGFVDGSMYDEGSALLSCPECNRYIWRDDVPDREFIQDSTYFNDPELRSLPKARCIGLSDYEKLLDQGLWKTEDQETYVRIRAWWSYNCIFRDHAIDDFRLSPKQESNLLRLLQLLNPKNPDEAITRAEILRELGEFDECLKQLQQPYGDGYLPVTDAIKKLANRKNRRVGIIG